MSKPETPKTEAHIPKAEIPRVELPFTGFEPWMKAATENLARLQSTITAYWDEIAGFENAAYERAKTATADLAKLANDSIGYASQLSAEWRKLGLEVTRKFTEQVTRSA